MERSKNLRICLNPKYNNNEIHFNTLISLGAKAIVSLLREFPESSVKTHYLYYCSKEDKEVVDEYLKELEKMNIIKMGE